MKRKFTLLCGCLLLLTCANVYSQRARFIKPLPHTSHMPGIHINNFGSCSPDTVMLTSQAQIDNFTAVYGSCQVFNYLLIDGAGASPAITNLAGLAGVGTINNKLLVQNTDVTDLSAMTGLINADTLELHNNLLMTSISLTNTTYLDDLIFVNLPSLSSIGLNNSIDSLGPIRIDSTGLTDFSGFSNIVATGWLDLEHGRFANLSGFSSLTHINYYLQLEDDTLLTSVGLNNLHATGGFLFGALPELTSIAGLADHLDSKSIGTFWFIQTGLSDLSGMDSVYSSSNFYIWLNPNLTSLHGLDNLTGSVDGLSIWGNDLLPNLIGLSNINNIAGTLEIEGNNSLTSLDGIGAVTNIDDGLWVYGTQQLTTLSSLHPDLIIQNQNGDNVEIHDNNVLAVCASTPICNYLNNNGIADIHDNADGCQSIEEVQAACEALGNCSNPDERVWTGNSDSDWDNADNWDPSSVPGPCTTVTIPSEFYVPNSPTATHALALRGLIMEQDAYLNVGYQGITLSKTLNISSADLEQAGTITAQTIFEPYVANSTIDGNLYIFDFGGNTELTDNSINGSVVMNDSIGRTGIWETYGNSINGSFIATQNSPNGNFSLGSQPYDQEYIGGNLTVVNNSLAPIIVGGPNDGRPLRILGNFAANTTNGGNINIGSLTFTGNNSGTLSIIGEPAAINTLVMETYGDVYLQQDTHITNFLDFDAYAGEIHSASDKLLIFDNNATVYQGGYGTGFVSGPVKKIGNQAFTFPIGKIEGQVWKAPLSISAPTSATDEFVAEYFHHNATTDGYDTSQVTSGFGNISGKEYWKLDRTAGTSNVTVQLAYDSGRSGPTQSYQSMQVAGWNGAAWRSWSTGGFTGYPYGGTLVTGTPVTQFGPFTFSFLPVRKPIITISSFDTIRCPGYWYLPFTLDTMMIQGNNFSARISDTSGVFSGESNYIGSKVSSTSDSIYCFYPAWVIPGKPYKVEITASSAPDTSVNTRTVVFYKYPQIVPTIGGNPVACVGGIAYKYYPTIHEPGVTYTWTLNGGGTFTTVGDTALVTWTATGNYYLTIITTNQCGIGSEPGISIQVHPATPIATPVINNSGRWLYSSAVPTGATYQWYLNGAPISGAVNNSYYASPGGDYTAAFVGICGMGPSSNTISFAANSLPQTITFPAIGNKNFGDAPFTPAATASSGLPVAFIIISGPASINAQTNVVTLTGTGTVTIQANQSGSNVYDTASSVTQTFNVNPGAQTIMFAPIAAQNISVGSITLNATASSSLIVTYSVVSGPATVSGNILTLTGIGTVTVKASQAGNANYSPAADVSVSFCSYVTNLGPVNGFNNLCPGTATYSVNNIIGATYSWRISGGSTLASTTSSAAVTWPAPGDYILIVNATGNCGSVSMNDSLSVHVINSILPDSVHSMLPADGTINLQLPLTLSWIPAQPANFYTFDLYLWKAEDPQPSTPYAAGLTAVDYTIPVNSGLLYAHPYKWMIVAHNGSCIQISTGPVQQFTLIPLPDLIVSNVQIPAAAFSGQTISINWTVNNSGPGKTTTSQNWTDAVFLSFDTIPNFTVPPQTNPAAWNHLEFPVRPLLVGTKPNVMALDAGQSYNNSISITLPLSYSQPLYAYVITNYPAGANAPVQVTTANDTARAPQPIIVTLSPTPDLRVDTVFVPSSTFSGSTVNVTYKVKNYGVLTPSGSGWTDAIYISQSPIFNPQTATLLKTPKFNGTYYANASDAVIYRATQLQQDSSYTVSEDVVIPNFIFGNYFIYVFTNTSGSLYEGALSNNNTNSSITQVFLTPTPHLTISTLTVPVSSASTTQPIGINWNILNTGFNDNIEKNKGHYFVAGGSCILYPGYFINGVGSTYFPPVPGIFLRDSIAFGGSSWTDRMYISPDSTGINASAIQIMDVRLGDPNAGANVPDVYNPQFAFNCRPTGSSGAQFNLNTQYVLNPNTNFGSGYTFAMPDYLPSGNYWIYVYTNVNHTVYEYPGTPEIKRSALPISVQRPDATVNAIGAPANSVGGQPLTINYTVLNNGPGAVFNHVRNDEIYVSSLPVLDGSAQLIGIDQYTEDLPVGTAVPHTRSYTFPPGTSGTRYFFVHTNYDSSFRETNSFNNISATAQTQVTPGSPADFIVSNIQLADTVYTAYGTSFKYTIQNNGIGKAAGTWTDSVFISCNALYNNSTNIFVAARVHTDSVAAGGTFTDSFYVTLPLSYYLNNCFTNDSINTAYFFVKTNANNGIYEGANTGNNITVSGSRVLVNPLVDLVVNTVTGADTAIAGRPYNTSWTVQNIGQNSGGYYFYGWNDGVFFSPDSTQTGNATFANSFPENSLIGHNQTYNGAGAVTVPNLPTGDYYLLVRTNTYNSITGERNFSNNTSPRRIAGAAQKVHVVRPLQPDLTDSIISCPSQVAVGQPITIIHRVTNIGPGVTYPATWGDDIWLSTDFIPNNGNDIRLSASNHSGGLLPGAYFDDTITAMVSIYAAPANYVLISRVNATGNVFETNTTNDLAFRYVNVYSPAPADLIVESISKPDTAYLGYELDTAKWVIRNNSPNTAAGVSSDGIYFSHNTVLDSTAVLMGIKSKTINMGPLSRDTITLEPVIGNVTEGTYNVLVKTDILNNIVESDKTNNVTVAPTPIYVSVKELHLNVLLPDALGSLNRIYKLIIPDSLSGSTIRVRLKSNDSLFVINQMFLGLGYVPDAGHFDYAYPTPNYGNQDIVITSVASGTYYITVRCVTPNPPTQNITLYAEKLPFLITDVESSSGGNIGNVTIKIDGSLFVNNMTATLTKSGTTINASTVYFANSTIVYATFNLQGKPLGIYDVTLTKPDTTMATLPQSFSIVAANNGGINTGGGVNTGSGDGSSPGCDPGDAAGVNSLLVTQLVVPEKVFVGWPFVIQINYNNPTNVDIPAQVRILYSQRDILMSLTPDGVATGTTALYMELTEQNGPPGIIRAGGSGTITVYAKAPISVPAHTFVLFNLK